MPPVKKTDTTYIISVSIGTGCYRHIKISGAATLFMLHEAILNAFDFDDDHAHAFFLNNIAWNDEASYYTQYMEDEKRYTNKYKLSKVLEKDMKFKYIFDFGDEWLFQCKVLKVLEEKCGEPQIVKSVGESPKQYPDYDDKEEYYEVAYDDEMLEDMAKKVLSLMTPDEVEFITKFANEYGSADNVDMETLFREFVQSNNVKYAIKGVPVHSIKDILELYNMTELRTLAKSWDVSSISKLKKEQLISEISKATFNTEILEGYLLGLSEYEWEFLISAAQADTYKDEKVIYNNMITLKNLMAVVLFDNDGELVFVVPDEIKEALRKLDENGFMKKKLFGDTMNKYASAAVNLYGAIEIDEFVKLYNSYTGNSVDKNTVTEAIRPYISDDGDYLLRKNYIISIEFDEIYGGIEELEQSRSGKPMYVPNKDEFLLYADFNYFEETPQTKKVLNLLKKVVEKDIFAENMLAELHYYIVCQESLKDILGNFEDVFDELTKSEVEAIITAITDMINNTRVWSNYGHTPVEIRRLLISNKK